MDRLYLFFDNEFTYYAHAMATWFKRDFGLSDASFRGMIIHRYYMDFLRNRQTDIKYGELAMWQDLFWQAKTEPPDLEFLQQVENDWDIDTLWRLRDADRSIDSFDYAQVLSVMAIFLKYYHKEFTEHRPDAVICFVVASLGAMACYYVARHLGIPFLLWDMPRLPGETLITDNPFNQFPAVDAKYLALLDTPDIALLERATAFIDSFREKPTPPGGSQRVLQILGKQSSLHPRRVIGLARVTYWYYFSHNREDVGSNSPFKIALDTLKFRWRKELFARKRPFETAAPNDEQYAFFPLHYQPESTTMVLAPYYLDQLALVENVARSLPVRMKLYVKEHLTMVGQRPFNYYERLKRIPNVRLIDPHISSFDVTRKAAIVVTITGTVGWEALLLRVPVITFGQVFYNTLDWVRKCRAIEDLPALVRDCLENERHEEHRLRAYVAALMSESFEFDLDQVSDTQRTYEAVRDSPEASTFYRQFCRKLRELKPQLTI